MHNALAAVIAFTALGANFFAVAVLLLLNPGSRSVRWYLPFLLTVNFWLLAQGAALVWPTPSWIAAQHYAVALLPMMFFVFAIMESSNRPTWHGLVLILLLGMLFPFAAHSIYAVHGASALFGRAWMYAG